jgi:photosystem II stability/assembly factor-like uncharacterized protein
MKTVRLVTLCVFVFCLLTLFSGFAAAQEADSGEESPEMIRQRDEWYHHQRAYPLKNIPAGLRVKALRKRQLMESQARTQALAHPEIAPPSATSAWTFVGPEPTIPLLAEAFGGSPNISGRVTAIAVDPTNASIVYAGGADGGVWKTTNGGTNWTPLTDSQVSLAIGVIAIDPSNHNIIYAGTGEDNNNQDGYTGAGLLKSTDGGATWTNLPGPFVGPFGATTGGGSIGSLAVNGQTLLAGVTLAGADGIYLSADGGSTWKAVLFGSIDPGTAVAIDPSNPLNVYAAIGYSLGNNLNNGVWKSTDGGTSWKPTSLSNSPRAGRIAMALAPSSPSTIYVSAADTATNTSGALLGMWRSANGGSTWTQLTATPNFCNPQCWYDMAIAVAPNNPNVIYGVGAYQYATNAQTTVVRSTDGGTTWSLLGAGANGTNIHTDGHAVAFSADGGTVYVGTDGGIWSTTNVTAATVNWTSLNSTLALTQFYNGMSIDPTNVNRGFAGAQDNGDQAYTGGMTWNEVAPCGDGGFTAIDPVTPNTVYVTGHGPCIQKSTTGGGLNTFTAVAPTLGSSDRISFIPPFVLDPSNPSDLYLGANLLYQSTDAATSWTAISPDLTNGGTVSAVAVAPSDSNTIYTGSDDALVAVTTTALSGTTSTWFNASTAATRAVTDIKVDATTSTTAYVTYGGFSGFGDTVGHVFETTNGGAAWADISGNLPNIPVTSIAIDPDVANTYYVGTDVGMFYTSNGGTTWSTLGTGLPNVGVMSLAFQHATRTLLAGTHGRSAWELNLANGFALTVTDAGTGTGKVTSTPSGITCPTSCSANFSSGTAVTLTAAAGTGSTFAGWSGACTGTGTCSVTMSAAKAVTATFNVTVTKFALTVSEAGTGTGTVSSSPTGISCPSTCSANFNSGTVVTLTAAAGTGSTFAGWSGACTGTGNCSVTMSAAKAATATFNKSGGPVVSLSPSSLGFGTVGIGVISPVKAVTLKNTGTSSLTITSIAITGTNSGDFAKTATTCGTSLGTGATCTVSVDFKPTASGARSANVSITDNATGSPQLVPLSGTGTTAKLAPTSLNFGDVATGFASPTKTVTLTNVGTSALTISTIAITGTNVGDFAQTHTCTTSLAVNASCTFTVTFKPTATGARSASLSVTDSASGSPQLVPLTGVGTTAKLAPASLNFADVATGVTSPAKTVTLTNISTTALTITTIAITGTNAGDFAQTHTCGTSLAAGASCTFSVTFKPAATGTRSASLSVTDNAPGSPQLVPLSGVGTTAKLSPTSLSFGTVTVGTTSAAKTVTLTNVGTAALTISSIAITGTNAGNFLQTHTCGASLAAGASCTFSVTFKPTATGARSASLSVTDNAPGSPQLVALSGTGG